jgi:hypothetical protein
MNVVGQVVCIPASYSSGSRFKFRPGFRLSGSFVVFLIPCGRMSG